VVDGVEENDSVVKEDDYKAGTFAVGASTSGICSTVSAAATS
jgi:hypothetical protein